jgi:hypothetical protein
MKKYPVLKGLQKCKKCGEYKGHVKEKNLPKGHRWFRKGDPERSIKVYCICDGIKCKVCGKKKVHRPCGSYYNKKDGCLWYVPGFIVLSPICNSCINISSESKKDE